MHLLVNLHPVHLRLHLYLITKDIHLLCNSFFDGLTLRVNLSHNSFLKLIIHRATIRGLLDVRDLSGSLVQLLL